MRISYKRLFRVQLRHGFYKKSRSTQDFIVKPSPSTAKVLSHHGFIFRSMEDGFSLYARVKPDSQPVELLNSLNEALLRLHFYVWPINPYILNISKLPDYQPGRQLFYFNNLRDDQEEQRLNLSDSVANKRIGAALQLVTGEVYAHRFLDRVTSQPLSITSATITIQDLLGKQIHTESFHYPDEPKYRTQEHRISLPDIQNLTPGRYLVTADQGKSQTMFYDPDLGNTRPLGVIEIFNRFNSLTEPPQNLVPESYRFLNGDQLTELQSYYVQIEARSTTWRYNIIKKYEKNNISLNQLSIGGNLTFEDPEFPPDKSDRVIFSTDAEEVLKEEDLQGTPRTIELFRSGTKFRTLPTPQMTTALKKGDGPRKYVSEIFVYL